MTEQLTAAQTKSETTSSTQELLINGRTVAGQETVLTEGSLCLLKALCKQFAPEVPELLARRKHKQKHIDLGELPDFLEQTRAIRQGHWQIRGIPADLQDRRVEITGPVERKLVINALNANAKVFMADFEDSLAPSWEKVVQGQINLRDAVNGDISYTAAETGKHYSLNEDPAVLICRVRGLHMQEKHVQFAGSAIPAALFDFCIYFYNNYRALL
ncbi:malate synthase A, partial [Shewanella sp. 0m-11]